MKECAVIVCYLCIIIPFRVAITRSHDIPYFGPEIPDNAVFDKNQNFREFILTKCMLRSSDYSVHVYACMYNT